MHLTHHSQIDWKKVFVLIALVVGVISLLSGGYYFMKSYFELKTFKDERDVDRYKSMLKKHMVLPKEEPIIASVKDVDKLKQEQPFYRNAINGDKVFIWTDKAVIYRPEEDRIIDFGIIIPKKSVSPSPQSSRVVNISVLSSSENSEEGSNITEALQNKQFQGISFAISNSSKTGSYKKTLIIDKVGGNNTIVNQLAEELGASIESSVPANEKVNNDSDIVIISKTE
jgi:anionic cell wall polymer biosynthesis LytR-Cps2A-Psr (LCP) family protein